MLSTAILLSTFIGILLGIYAAWKRGIADLTVTSFSTLIRAIPYFWFALLSLLIFAFWFGIFPLGGIRTVGGEYSSVFDKALDIIKHLALPIINLTLFYLATTVLLTRNSLIIELQEDYVITARAKGVPEFGVIFKHALRNAILPVVTNTGINLGFAVGGAILTETVFGLPGMGSLMFKAVMEHDYPLLQAGFFFISAAVIFMMFIIDILYGIIDPRVRYE